MTETTQTVSIRNVKKSYLEGGNNRIVLDHASCDFEAGLMHAVMGPSGTGKSTLLNLIAGIDLPDSGTIAVNGNNITALKQRQRTLFRRLNIGIVFQFFNLINSLTVAENVMLPLELSKQPDREQRTSDALDRVGLLDRSDSFPTVLSGGEQQRVAIARAIVHRPSLILADEPTGNLDENTAERVMSTLDESRDNATVIMVTHSLEIAEKCDRQWQLRSGAMEMH